MSPDGMHINVVGYTTLAAQSRNVWVRKYSAVGHGGETVFATRSLSTRAVSPSTADELLIMQDEQQLVAAASVIPLSPLSVRGGTVTTDC